MKKTINVSDKQKKKKKKKKKKMDFPNYLYNTTTFFFFFLIVLLKANYNSHLDDMIVRNCYNVVVLGKSNRVVL